jgi:hypothetical protein
MVDAAGQMARFVPVRTGIVDGGQVEIIEPKDVSGRVVVLGHYLLETEGRIILPASELGSKPGLDAEAGGGEK